LLIEVVLLIETVLFQVVNFAVWIEILEVAISEIGLIEVVRLASYRDGRYSALQIKKGHLFQSLELRSRSAMK
jgi:hypothetical protein